MDQHIFDLLKLQLSEQHNYVRVTNESTTKIFIFVVGINAAVGAWAVHQNRIDETPHIGIATVFILINILLGFSFPKVVSNLYGRLNQRIKTILSAIAAESKDELAENPELKSVIQETMTPVEEWESNTSLSSVLFYVMAVTWFVSFFIFLPLLN